MAGTAYFAETASQRFKSPTVRLGIIREVRSIATLVDIAAPSLCQSLAALLVEMRELEYITLLYQLHRSVIVPSAGILEAVFTAISEPQQGEHTLIIAP